MKKTLLSLMLGAAGWVHAQADDIASIQFDYADDRTATGLKTTAFCAAQNNDANWSLESATGSHSSALLEAFTDPKCTGFSGDNRVMDADAVGRYLRESVMVDAENGYPTGAFAVSKVTGEAKTVIGFSFFEKSTADGTATISFRPTLAFFDVPEPTTVAETPAVEATPEAIAEPTTPTAESASAEPDTPEIVPAPTTTTEAGDILTQHLNIMKSVLHTATYQWGQAIRNNAFPVNDAPEVNNSFWSVLEDLQEVCGFVNDSDDEGDAIVEPAMTARNNAFSCFQGKPLAQMTAKADFMNATYRSALTDAGFSNAHTEESCGFSMKGFSYDAAEQKSTLLGWFNGDAHPAEGSLHNIILYDGTALTISKPADQDSIMVHYAYDLTAGTTNG